MYGLRTDGNVYIVRLRLDGRKLPMYELMLDLLGVTTMYGSVFIVRLRLGDRKIPTYELMLRLLGVTTMYGWILGLFIMYKLRSKRQKNAGRETRFFIFGSDIVMK